MWNLSHITVEGIRLLGTGGYSQGVFSFVGSVGT
jgi:hypothetical protein